MNWCCDREQPGGVPNCDKRIIGMDLDDSTFEDLFFKRFFYNGESLLDPALFSLLHFTEVCEAVCLSNGKTILIDVNSIRRRCMSAGGNIKRRFKSLEKSGELDRKDPLSYKAFCDENHIKLDNIQNYLPLYFEDFRTVVHCLKLSRAIYLTMKMHKISDFKYLQRVRKGRGTHWNKTHKFRSGNYLSSIFCHLFSSLRSLGISDEKAVIKCFKTSLCYHVSESLDQAELPEGAQFDLIPYPFRKVFNELSKEKKINFFFSQLQSKALCEEVPESFVQETLEKHRDQLSSPHQGISKETLELLAERGKSFGKIVKRFYQPNSGFHPSNRATFAFPRSAGGVKGDLVFNDCVHNSLQSNDANDRMEPTVIGLFGQPAQGKSLHINWIVNILKILFPGVSRENLVYERTCNTDHWDGYTGQPIVVLDDLGQSKSGDDIKEFQTLVSCNPYVLPMAELSEKGMKFTSSIIICTSNLKYGFQLSQIYEGSDGIIDDASFWRRFHVPLYVENRKIYKLRVPPNWVRNENLLTPDSLVPERLVHKPDFTSQSTNKQFFQRVPEFRKETKNEALSNIWTGVSTSELSDHLFSLHRERTKFHDNYRKTWSQVIESKIDEPIENVGKNFWNDQIEPFLPTSMGFDVSPHGASNSHSLTFSAYPPAGPLPVRVQPITEPLKVRTITAGIGETFVLKPFARAMWHALGCEPQFTLTHGTQNLEPAINRIYENSDENDSWLSGDYSAATDSFAIEASQALMEGILESIDHEPTRRWAMKEVSQHLLVYPKGSGLQPVLQESGQLMGSLMSFPLLCLLNDCTAKHIGLRPDQYLINGDDILMRTNSDNYPKWKEKVQEFGLSLSAGKNYIHKDYGTVNSQLIRKGKVLNTGKQKVLDRHSHVLGECLRDLEILMDSDGPDEVHDLFVSVNRSKLSRTVRSIRVPVSHGGLSFNWGSKQNVSSKTLRTERLVYLHELFKKIEPQKGCLAIPYLSQEKRDSITLQSMDRLFNEPIDSSEYHEDFIGIPDLKKVESRIRHHYQMRTKFSNMDIEDLPPLNFLRVAQVPFKDIAIRKDLQSQIDSMFFQRFFDADTSFTFEEFQKGFLDGIKGTKNASALAVEYLVPIIELELKPDFLPQLVTGYKAIDFDRDSFSKPFSGKLKPKDFDIGDYPPISEAKLEEIYHERVKTLQGLACWNDEPPNFTNLSWKDVMDTQLSRTSQLHDFNSNSLDYYLQLSLRVGSKARRNDLI